MITYRILLVCIPIFILALLAPTIAYSQADPEWMKNWDQAWDNRPSVMTSKGVIADKNEVGSPLIIRGHAYNPDGTVANGIIVHAYHRDHAGFEFGKNDKALTTWRLQGWVKTDSNGKFEFETIRPAADHLEREEAHIHFTTQSTKFGRQWAPTIYLADDFVKTNNNKHQVTKTPKVYDGVEQIEIEIRLKQKADF